MLVGHHHTNPPLEKNTKIIADDHQPASKTANQRFSGHPYFNIHLASQQLIKLDISCIQKEQYYLPWEPKTFIFSGYNAHIGGLKPSFSWVLDIRRLFQYKVTLTLRVPAADHTLVLNILTILTTPNFYTTKTTRTEPRKKIPPTFHWILVG